MNTVLINILMIFINLFIYIYLNRKIGNNKKFIRSKTQYTYDGIEDKYVNIDYSNTSIYPPDKWSLPDFFVLCILCILWPIALIFNLVIFLTHTKYLFNLEEGVFDYLWLHLNKKVF